MLAVISSQWWVLVLLGFAAGILSALLGIGSGIVMVPALVIMLALPQKAAQGIALTVMVPMAIVGAARYWMTSNIDIPGYTRPDILYLTLWVAIGAVVGPLLGAHLAGRLPNHVLRMMFGAFIIVVGIHMLVTKPKDIIAPSDPPPAATSTPPGGSDNASVK